MLVIALLIRMTSPGPGLFRQRRVGAQERCFTIFKFRTMVVNADAQRDGLASEHEADGLLFKMRRDPRVDEGRPPAASHIARRTAQLFNVLRGEMSLVGPRPALPDEPRDMWKHSARGSRQAGCHRPVAGERTSPTSRSRITFATTSSTLRTGR